MRLLVVSNRLPMTMGFDENGKRTFRMSSGGLVAALSGVRELYESFVWLGWIGSDVPEEDREEVTRLLWEHNCIPVFVNEEVMDLHYNGFSNNVIWPLFHYMPGEAQFNPTWWSAYQTANQAFADAISNNYQEGDIVWVHDYHLMLMPQMLRSSIPHARIGFFLHIPFPSSEIYRMLQVRKEVLRGLVHCDLIGFHTYDYARHFKKACTYVLGLETDPNGVDYNGRYVDVGVFPVGIDPSKFEETLAKASVQDRIKELRTQFKDREILIGVDRLDYIKGVPHKLHAMELFLKQHPEWQGKVTLVQVAVPSRTDVPEYQKLKAEVDELVGRINGQYGFEGSETIKYLFTSVPFDELCALYSLASVLVVSSVRDGMNLVSQEYLMCQKESHGRLVLSEFAGAAQSLSGGILVNPWDFQDMADAIHMALTMPEEERKERHSSLYEYIKQHTAAAWGQSFVEHLNRCSLEHATVRATPMLNMEQMISNFKSGANRLLIFDCDGALAPSVSLPGYDKPEASVLADVRKLSEDPRNTVFVLSGRRKQMLDDWFGDMNVGLMAEFGFFYRLPGDKDGKQWRRLLTDPDLTWMATISPVLEYFAERTPNAVFEQKEASLTWNFKHAYPPFGTFQARELQLHLDNNFGKLPIDVVYSSEEKALHVRPQHSNLDAAVKTILTLSTGEPDEEEGESPEGNSNEPPENKTDNERMMHYRRVIASKGYDVVDFLLYIGKRLTQYDFDTMADSPDHVYTVTTGKKTENTSFYLGFDDVAGAVHSLATACEE